MYERIARKLYELFVLNNKAVAVQTQDGKYITKKVVYNYKIFEKMLEKKSSLGIYQQQYCRDVLKWICIDFDCKLEAEDIYDLIKEYIIPFQQYLKSIQINHLIEFSGRRGIHIWIHFNTIISKREGYRIIKKLIDPFYEKIKNDNRFGVDLFPAVATTHNKYGKNVKVPLSRHRKGTYSYFIENLQEFKCKQIEKINESFLKEQLDILNRYKYNMFESVIKAIELDYIEETKEYIFSYKKEYILLGREISIEDLEVASRGCRVLYDLFFRIRNGNMTYMDRKVLVATFVHINGCEKILFEMFKLQNNYNELITEININKLKRKYYPPTLGFLYDMYNEEMEVGLDSNQTSLEFIITQLGISYNMRELNQKIQHLSEEEFIMSVVEKEKRYILLNDEVVDIDIFNSLNSFHQFDINRVKDKMEEVFSGVWEECVIGQFRKYIRQEKNYKQRNMISLGAFDRVLTTALIIELTKTINYRFHSYSYNINPWEDGDIFFPWYYSWKRFQADVSAYFTTDLFEDYSVIKIDLRNFYDSIYLHAVYKQMKDLIKVKTEQTDKAFNIMRYLFEYNEKLMKENNGLIRGVPQGPAYARVIAEFFLATILEEFFERFTEYSKESNLYRYVDDIYIICNDEVDGDKLLQNFDDFLAGKGLSLNLEKTKNYGKIGEMSEYDKVEIAGWNSMNYEIKSIQNLELEEDEEREAKIDLFDRFLHRNKEWDINDANFVLNTYIDNYFVTAYINKYFDDLIKADFGRGSIFTKFYEIILQSERMQKRFFQGHKYKFIPFKTLNLKNFLNSLYFNFNKVVILDDEIKWVEETILYFKNKENMLDEDELTTVEAIYKHVLRLKERCGYEARE